MNKWLCHFSCSSFHLADHIAIVEAETESNAKTAAIKEWGSVESFWRNEVTVVNLEDISLPWSIKS